jgi:hypothetical protein
MIGVCSNDVVMVPSALKGITFLSEIKAEEATSTLTS